MDGMPFVDAGVKRKVFVVGRNKTGTTSITKALSQLGYRVGSQAEAELLLADWSNKDFDRIKEHCGSADAFQDIPFGNSFTYEVMDDLYPDAKFILTVRNSSQEWYESLVRFHTKIIGKNRLPTSADLKVFPYRYKGWLWEVQQLVYGVDENNLYDKDLYIHHYESHNSSVISYFSKKTDKLLVLNLSESDSMKKLCEFLDVPDNDLSMPHANKT